MVVRLSTRRTTLSLSRHLYLSLFLSLSIYIYIFLSLSLFPSIAVSLFLSLFLCHYIQSVFLSYFPSISLQQVANEFICQNDEGSLFIFTPLPDSGVDGVQSAAKYIKLFSAFPEEEARAPPPPPPSTALAPYRFTTPAWNPHTHTYRPYLVCASLASLCLPPREK